MKAKLRKDKDHYRLFVEDKQIGSTGTRVSSKEMYQLSFENCDEMFGVVDVEKLAEESWGDKISSPYHAYIEGFNKAIELYQPTEIEVEIEMRNSRTGNIVKHDSDLEWDEDGLCDRAIPKLDSEGCLILKKI
jgi:hypothetical protein